MNCPPVPARRHSEGADERVRMHRAANAQATGSVFAVKSALASPTRSYRAP